MSRNATETKQISRRSEKPMKDYEAVNVLLIMFEFTDLDELETETRNITKDFENLNYMVFPPYRILMDKKVALEELIKRLSEFLKEAENKNVLSIIHYNGHGGRGGASRDTLCLSSHQKPSSIGALLEDLSLIWPGTQDEPLFKALVEKKSKFQPIAKILWKDISPTIMGPKCDTLVILDCCSAGLAAVDSQIKTALYDSYRAGNKGVRTEEENSTDNEDPTDSNGEVDEEEKTENRDTAKIGGSAKSSKMDGKIGQNEKRRKNKHRMKTVRRSEPKPDGANPNISQGANRGMWLGNQDIL